MPDAPEDVIFAVNRLGYGPRSEDYHALLKQGVGDWLEEQLSPPPGDDSFTTGKLDACQLHIKYDAVEGKYPAVDEMRPLVSLHQPIEQAWAVYEPGRTVNGQERTRPRTEVTAAALIRAVYSKYQLREVLVQFWNDHFHVNTYSDDRIATSLATYDRDVIRKNCLGNFRVMLEDVASSTAMLYYLSNHSSRAGSANENYARELFELHSFGREHYLNDRYDRWHDVPGAANGHPEGYIDQDVYEAARAFTGWTVEDGTGLDSNRKLPSTGKFAYVENWHDGYQKRVLATEFEPFSKPQADGKKVLDLIGDHASVALHLVTKLCTRLIGPEASPTLISRVVGVWRQNVASPDQIAKVVREIALSPEFAQSRGLKVKRPLALMANFVRVMGYDFIPSEGLANQLANAGQRLYGWPTPAGLPDDNQYFVGSNVLRNRWGLVLGLAQNSWGNGTIDASQTLSNWGGKIGKSSDTVAEWFRLFGTTSDEKLIQITSVAAGLLPYAELTDGDSRHLAFAAAIAAMAPEFQLC